MTKNPRQKSSLWIYGKHPVKQALENPNRIKLKLLLTKSAAAEFDNLKKDYPVDIVDGGSITRILKKQDAVHQGIALEVERKTKITANEYLEQFSHKKRDVIIALDQITDPQNVGAIIRSATAFGAPTLLTTKDNSFQETSALAKASSGYLENITIIESNNLINTFDLFKKNNYWVVGLDGEAKSYISDAKKFDKIILVMGAEGKGLRRLTQECCDILCKIKMSNGVESLNVSNAAAITLYEIHNAHS